ncbi:IS1595 family transposase [Candidatus Daviesbacteria bacterium]|nr:IS1595 family transposase [Candidatus Daviesbacteria bacterium]
MIKFTIKDFNTLYPDEEACIKEVFNRKFSTLTECPVCKNPFKYYKVRDRKCYACQYCANQIHPLANTIFHKSDTSIKSWFYAIFLFSVSKNGVSAKELERQLGVTYKCAWRVANKVRTLFTDSNNPLKNIVEVDETYVGGKGENNKRGRGSENKTPVFGMVERQGIVRARVTVDTKRKTVMPIIRENVVLGSEIMSDEYLPYRTLPVQGYKHSTVNHGIKEYARGNVHTNSIEGFWSQLKRSLNGTYHAVSPKYLQEYVNEFSYRYNQRYTQLPVFTLLMGKI